MKSFFQGFIYRRLPGRGVVVAAGARVGAAAGFAQDVRPVLEIATGRHWRREAPAPRAPTATNCSRP